MKIVPLLFFPLFLLSACHSVAPRVNENSVQPEVSDSSQGLSGENLVLANELQYLIHQAKAKKLDVTREDMTLHTATLFSQWAAWDEENTELLTKFYQDHPKYKKDAKQLAESLPSLERQGINYILQDAISTLTLVLEGTIIRPDVPELDWAALQLKGNQILQGEQPVYLADYTWKPVSKELDKYYGRLEGAYITPSNIDKKGVLKAQTHKEFSQRATNNIGSTFVDHNRMPDWILEQYPDFTVGQRHYGKFDIDHPAAKELYKKLFAEMVPLLKGKPHNQLGYMLFNEPSYFTAENTWNTGVVSQYTLDNFETWLQDKHKDIAVLNALWNTNYKTFSDINIQIPMAQNLRSRPKWFDWMTFNNHRVSNWFAFLIEQIKSHDPQAKTHIKLMPWLWNKDKKDHGMDFENLLEMTDIIGVDADMKNAVMWGKEDWQQKYIMDWQPASMMFDFMTSVQPEQIIFDSENHFVSAVRFADRDIAPEYIRAAFWTGFMHGLDATSTWVWSRNPDGSIIQNREVDLSYVVAVTQQPKVLNELTKTVMDINSVAEEMDLFQSQVKPIRLFYSKTSAINQNHYMSGIHKAYEHLAFEGVPLGFVTQNIFQKQQGNWPVVVVKNAQYVSTGELSELQNYLDSGGSVIIDHTSVKFNEYGQRHVRRLEASKGKLVYYSNDNHILDFVMQELTVKALKPSLSLVEYNAEQLVKNDDKTVMWRKVTNSQQQEVVSLTNYGKQHKVVRLRKQNGSKDLTMVNVLTQENMGQSITLKPYQVELVRLGR